MATNDIYELVLGMNVKGQKVVNVMTFFQTAVDGPLPPNKDLALAFEEDILPAYADCCSVDLGFESIRTRRISPTPGGTYVHTLTTPGAVAQDTLPPNSAALISMYTPDFTRRGRGRLFVPGVPDTFTDGGRITNTAAATYVAMADLLKVEIYTATGTRFQYGIWKPGTPAFSAMFKHMLRSQLVTLRSRRMENP